ncbi:hypothetical protein BC835DRAFT_878285 [Cytidiella melzeri]|nr:hypothetical protein BC835DRAFT_878285 [Cytidiella melzeri]
MSAAELPPYTPSIAMPYYTAELQEGEQRLSSVQHASNPTGQVSLEYNHGDITITMHEQEPGVEVPTYTHAGIVKGTVDLAEDSVLSVLLKLEGRQSVAAIRQDLLEEQSCLFSDTYELWKKRDGVSCPPTLDFSIPFPTTYQDKHHTATLPPSFTGRYPGEPSIWANVWYILRVIVIKRRFGSWEKRRTLSQVISYRPQSSPALPIPPNLLPLLSVVTPIPEGWQTIFTIIPSRRRGTRAIDCHLFIPAGGIYAIMDRIPFHLQLRAPADHLIKLTMRGAPLAEAATAGLSGLNLRSFDSTPPTVITPPSRNLLFIFHNLLHANSTRMDTARSANAASVRVYLQRMITSKARGQNVRQTVIAGEATLTEMALSDSEDVLAWGGYVSCTAATVNTAGFSTNAFEVKDFLVVHIKPASLESSPWIEHKHAHPIQLVPDSYRENRPASEQ